MKTTEEITKQLNDAVSVIILSPEIRKFLTVVDPKALEQCFDAFNAYRNAEKGSPFDCTEWSEITEAAWFAMRHHFSDLAGYLDVSDEYLETLKAKLNNHLNNEE